MSGAITAAVVGGAIASRSSRKAADKQVGAIKEGQEISREEVARARADIDRLFPQAQEAQQMGFQDAINLLTGTMPQQFSYTNDGNVNAQQSLLSAAAQFQNAILGQPVDYSVFQAQSMPDFSSNMAFRNIQTPFYQMEQTTNQTPSTQEPYMGIPGNADAPMFSSFGDVLSGMRNGTGLGFLTAQNPQGQWFDSGSYRTHMDDSALNSTALQEINPALDPSRRYWRNA